jgi:hypothetical protein
VLAVLELIALAMSSLVDTDDAIGVVRIGDAGTAPIPEEQIARF